RFSRRVGAIIGMAVAVAITATGFTAEIPLSAYASWDIHPAGLAYVLIGAAALIAGVVSLFTFGPTGIHGIGVDVIHAFRVPQATVRAAEATGTDAQRADAQEAGAHAPGAHEAGARHTGVQDADAPDSGPDAPPTAAA